MPLYEGALGPFHRTVTTDSRDAQAYFDQGIQLMYAFTPERAARSFREAQALDPECAMCYWGEAWAWGPYLNGGMSDDDAPRAYAAARRAQELAATDGDVPPVERALIEAMATRYEPTHDVERRSELDSIYSEAMADVRERFPTDLEAGTLYGESLMLLESPRADSWELDNPLTRRAHRVLEDVLSRELRHPGACHLYIHATESTEAPEKAEPCAEHLGTAIPGASHVNHMPSHTFNRIGRWNDGVRANLRAWHSDLTAREGGDAFAIYPSHNLHMLLFAASMAGQGGVAIQAGKDYDEMVGDGDFYHALTLLRFGRFHEILALDDRPESPARAGMHDFARGYAHLRVGAPDSARVHLERVRATARDHPDEIFRRHTTEELLGVVGDILEAEIRAGEGDPEAAVAAARRAVEQEDALSYDEPEPLNFSARHWLGALLLEAGRPEEAGAVYRESLEDHPRNGWALIGLENALRARGLDYEADRVRDRLDETWPLADHRVPASRF
jgi:tetratricopeptide (TPR) repeat protein